MDWTVCPPVCEQYWPSVFDECAHLLNNTRANRLAFGAGGQSHLIAQRIHQRGPFVLLGRYHGKP